MYQRISRAHTAADKAGTVPPRSQPDALSTTQKARRPANAERLAFSYPGRVMDRRSDRSLVLLLAGDGVHEHGDSAVASDVAGSAEGVLSDVQSDHQALHGLVKAQHGL